MTTDMTKDTDALIAKLTDMCAAMEYWAGCDEGCSEDEAASEIMSGGGAWPATSYEQARALLATLAPDTIGSHFGNGGGFDPEAGLGFDPTAEVGDEVFPHDVGEVVPVACLPETIGRLHLGERLARNERLCNEGHTVPDGHPLYWPQQMGEYDDHDPYCLTHAIEQAESDAGWCAKCLDHEHRNSLAHPPHPAPVVSEVAPADPFQHRVEPWLMECFGPKISADMLERADRFTEEALELAQTMPGFTAERAHALVDYVFGRSVGEREQEVGGVMVTLAALCLAAGLNMHEAGEIELSRILQPQIVKKIRAKQAAKPTGSALPIADCPSSPDGRHQVDTSMESGPFNCFHCERPMLRNA